MDDDNWICPYCAHANAPTPARRSDQIHDFSNGSRHGPMRLISTIRVCANPECQEFELSATLYPVRHETGSAALGGFTSVLFENRPAPRLDLTLRPRSTARPVPDYVPEAVRADYEEACTIRSDSPKAAATLARRCLQGMIRDRWGVKKRNLAREIEAIRDEVDPLTWEALDAVRAMGNIGAHMEQDVNLIIEIDEGEAAQLIQLIETLIADWYVQRHEREQRLRRLVDTNAAKQRQRRGEKEAESEASNGGAEETISE